MARLGWPVLALGVLSAALWLSSYSWLLGLTPPTQWLSRDLSPWFVAEAAAVPTGALALLGGVAMALSALSILATA